MEQIVEIESGVERELVVRELVVRELGKEHFSDYDADLSETVHVGDSWSAQVVDPPAVPALVALVEFLENRLFVAHADGSEYLSWIAVDFAEPTVAQKRYLPGYVEDAKTCEAGQFDLERRA